MASDAIFGTFGARMLWLTGINLKTRFRKLWTFHKNMQKQSDTSHESNFFRDRTSNESTCIYVQENGMRQISVPQKKKLHHSFQHHSFRPNQGSNAFACCAFLPHPLLPLWAEFKSTGFRAHVNSGQKGSGISFTHRRNVVFNKMFRWHVVSEIEICDKRSQWYVSFMNTSSQPAGQQGC